MPPRALSDLRIIEIGNFVAGPFAARLLADAGAEVIKVESLEGDSSRRRGPFPTNIPDPEYSGLYRYLNANKLGVAINLAEHDGAALLYSLLSKTDILLVEASASNINRLGLRYSSLKLANPCLIVVAITPFGLFGPRHMHLGEDLISLSAGGLAYATPGVPDMPRDPYEEPPLRANTHIGEYVAGIQAASAALCAATQRMTTGCGFEVDISKQEAVAMLMAWEIAHASYLMPKRRGPEISGAQPNAYLPCKNGYVVVAGFLEHHWRGIVRAMGNPDWASSEIFASATERARNWDALEPLLLEWTLSHTGEEIAKLAQDEGVPCFLALTIEQMVDSPHVKSRAYLRKEQLPNGSLMLLPGFPVRMSETAWSFRRRAPALGEHTNEVLIRYLGCSRNEVARLHKTGVVA